jgi:DNA-binding LytR/AlgR family response regulator
MNILVIEDEKHNADRMIRLLNGYDWNCRVFGPLGSVVEVRDFFQGEDKVDLILSDIRLTDGLSFDALKDVPGDIPVIFTTAYDEYALRAFNYNGIAYLLKPIEKDELAETIEKVRRMASSSASREIAEIYRLLQGKSVAYRQRFLIPDRDGYITVPVSQVSYVSTESGVTRLFLKNKKQYAVDISLDDLEAQLDPSQFFRATRQQIVNISSVQRISNWFNRKIKIILSDYPDAEIVVGKEKATRLKQWLDR